MARIFSYPAKLLRTSKNQLNSTLDFLTLIIIELFAWKSLNYHSKLGQRGRDTLNSILRLAGRTRQGSTLSNLIQRPRRKCRRTNSNQLLSMHFVSKIVKKHSVLPATTVS